MYQLIKYARLGKNASFLDPKPREEPFMESNAVIHP